MFSITFNGSQMQIHTKHTYTYETIFRNLETTLTREWVDSAYLRKACSGGFGGGSVCFALKLLVARGLVERRRIKRCSDWHVDYRLSVLS